MPSLTGFNPDKPREYTAKSVRHLGSNTRALLVLCFPILAWLCWPLPMNGHARSVTQHERAPTHSLHRMQGPHGSLPLCAGGILACEGRHAKANPVTGQRQQTTPDGQLQVVAEDVRGSWSIVSPPRYKAKDGTDTARRSKLRTQNPRKPLNLYSHHPLDI